MKIFVYEPGGVIGSQDHACFEAQRRIGKRFYHHIVGENRDAAGRTLWFVPEPVNSVTTADRDFDSPNQYVFSASQDWRNRGLLYSHTGQQGMLADQRKNKKLALTPKGLGSCGRPLLNHRG
jgi:hypothetical protein